MNVTLIKEMQSRIKVTPDGFWGPVSIAACQAHLRKLMPKKNPWPKSDQFSLTRFYGRTGDESKLLSLSVKDLDVRYDGAKVNTILCHEEVSKSLRKVLEALATTHPHILREYNGCYNNRKMRGGSLPSLHARGAAIDFCASTNANRSSWPVASSMPIQVMEYFACEGWLSAGAFWGRDAMHHEAVNNF